MRRRRPSSLSRALPLVVAALATAPRAHAAPATEGPTGHIVFARDGALWRFAASGGDEPTKLADLPDGEHEVRAIASSANGRLLVLDLDGVAAWVQPGPDGEARRVATTRCNGPGRPAPNGSRLVCPLDATTTIVQPIAWRSRELDLVPDDVHILGASEELLVGADGELHAVVATAPSQARMLAPHRPEQGLLVAPNGERAVGRYTDGGQPAVYGFRLDGTAARRKLGGDLLPAAWSPDSQWVLFSHARRACLARAVGGEYKCWERYAALAFSPDSRFVLLGRKGAIYAAPIDGVEPARPKRIVEAAGPATWIP